MPHRDEWDRIVVSTASAPTVIADSTPEPMAIPPPGTVLGGKYRVEQVLGRGGMGIVLEATHLGLAQRVAIKFLRNEAKAVAGSLDRFAREARAAAQVRSEHAVRVFDTGVFETGEPYIVMELLNGEDLRALLERRGALTVREATSFVIEACEALAQAHALGIVHRDLKPANLFVATRADSSVCIKVLDFGISKLHAEPGAQTSANVALGSPRYMSPEQIQTPRDVDARADVWALGVVLYETLSGRAPFDAEGIVGLAAAIATQTPAPLSANVPSDLARIVSRCLEKDRRHRFASAAELAGALRPFASTEAALVADRIARLASSGLVTPAPSSREPSPSGFEPTVKLSGADAPMVARSGVIKRQGSSIMLPIVVSLSVVVLVAGGLVLIFALRATRPPAVAQPVASASAPPASASVAASAAPTLASSVPETLAPGSSMHVATSALTSAPTPVVAHTAQPAKPRATASASAVVVTTPPPAHTSVDLNAALRDRK